MDVQRIENELLKIKDISLAAGLLLEEFESVGNDLMKLNKSKPSLVKKAWLALRLEVYDLICTDKVKYSRERKLLESTATPAVSIMTAFLVENFGIATGTSASLAALSLYLPIRMSKNAWCDNMKYRDNLLTPNEKVMLKNLSEKK